jgi:ribonuclease VapC
MIAVDTSALMELLLLQARADDCKRALVAQTELVISAGTLAEALIVADRRGVGDKVSELIDSLPFEVVPVTAATARGVALAYARWGKGVHPAGLNLGDCFAYETAQSHACPLLFVGNDFAKTDVRSAL